MTPVENVTNAPDPAPMPASGSAPAPAALQEPATPHTAKIAATPPASATPLKGATSSSIPSRATTPWTPAASSTPGTWRVDSPKAAESQIAHVEQEETVMPAPEGAQSQSALAGLAEGAVPAPGSAESVDARVAELRKQLILAKEKEDFIACFQYQNEIKMLEAMKKNHVSETGGRRTVGKAPPRMTLRLGHTWVFIVGRPIKRALALLPKDGGTVVLRKHWLQDPLAGPLVLATNSHSAESGTHFVEIIAKGALMEAGGNLVAAVSKKSQRQFVEVNGHVSLPGTLCQGRERPSACVHHRAMIASKDVVQGLTGGRDKDKPVNVVFTHRIQDSDKDAWGRAR